MPVSDLDAYKAEMTWALDMLGLKSFDLYVIKDETIAAYAETITDTDGRRIDSKLGKIPQRNYGDYPNRRAAIKSTARHEAAHAFLAAFSDLAHDRFTTERDLDREEESIVVTLTKLLDKLRELLECIPKQ